MGHRIDRITKKGFFLEFVKRRDAVILENIILKQIESDNES